MLDYDARCEHGGCEPICADGAHDAYIAGVCRYQNLARDRTPRCECVFDQLAIGAYQVWRGLVDQEAGLSAEARRAAEERIGAVLAGTYPGGQPYVLFMRTLQQLCYQVGYAAAVADLHDEAIMV